MQSWFKTAVTALLYIPRNSGTNTSHLGFWPVRARRRIRKPAINPIAHYHNLVPREQGNLSLRMFHHSWGLMLTQQDTSAPSTCSTPYSGDEIDYAVSHGTDFHQFMLYTPVPATPLYQQMTEQERMLDDVELADIHRQFKFNFRQAAISRDESKQFFDGAFRQDFEENGPSLFRICQTLFNGWQRYKDHPEARVRARLPTRRTSFGQPITRRCGRWSEG